MVWIIKKSLRMLGNFYWKLIGGIILPTLWVIIGTIFLATVVGTPLAINCYRVAWTIFKPFGKDVAIVADRPFMSVLWVMTGGLFMAVISIINALASVFTIVGIPFAKQWYKVILMALFPFCTRVVRY